MRRHNGRVYRVVRAILKDEAEAEDAIQQAYISAFMHLPQFNGTARFSTWLTRIAINEATTRVRKRRRLHLLDDAMDEPADHNPSPEDVVVGRELTGLVEAIVDGLPEPHRLFSCCAR